MPHGISQADCVQGMYRVGHQPDAGADFAQLRGAFINFEGQAGTFERYGGSEPADATADDEDWNAFYYC